MFVRAEKYACTEEVFVEEILASSVATGRNKERSLREMRKTASASSLHLGGGKMKVGIVDLGVLSEGTDNPHFQGIILTIYL